MMWSSLVMIAALQFAAFDARERVVHLQPRDLPVGLMRASLQPTLAAAVQGVPVVSVGTGKPFPQEIREPTGRYVRCLTDSVNLSMRSLGGVREGAVVRRFAAKARAECSAVRKDAAARSLLALKQAGWSRRDRERAVEETLADGEAHWERFADMVDRTNRNGRKRTPEGGAGSPGRPTQMLAVPAARLAIAPELAPAVVPYLACTLREHDSALSVRGGKSADLPLVYADMMAACADARTRALAEGERLLRGTRGFARAAARRAHVEASLRQIEDRYRTLHGAVPSMNPAPEEKP